MVEKRFYWLKLKDNFFQEDAIEWLEEQQNGKEYVLFYLKLCLKSLRNNGVLVRKVGDILIPYDVAKLAEITKTNPDTVVVAMEILKKSFRPLTGIFVFNQHYSRRGFVPLDYSQQTPCC